MRKGLKASFFLQFTKSAWVSHILERYHILCMNVAMDATIMIGTFGLHSEFMGS